MTGTADHNIAANLAQVRAEIADAERAAGRAAGSVTLVAVSKTFGAEDIAVAIAAGQRVFGENRLQESEGKWPALRERHPDLELHMIGGLQSRKVKGVVELFDVIHGIDRDKLADAVARASDQTGRRPGCLVQVNTGAEPQKSGVLPGDADALVRHCRDMAGLDLRGLMCIPPVDADPAPHFRLLAEIAARNGLAILSMGMSADYAAAIAAGATHVRVGTAIFGRRAAPA